MPKVNYCVKCGLNTTNESMVCNACGICDGPQGYLEEIFSLVKKRQKRFRESELYLLMIHEVLTVAKPDPMKAMVIGGD